MDNNNNNFMQGFLLGEQERQTEEMREFRKAYCKANGIDYIETEQKSFNFSVPYWLKALLGGAFTGILILIMLYIYFIIA